MKAIKTVVILATLAAALFVARPADAAMIAVGEPFPAWSLSDHEGKTVSSKDLAGKRYLMWFYPAAMTPGCTVEGQTLRDANERFAAEGVEIFGISFDEPAKNARFVEAENFPYQLLTTDADFAMKVGAASSPQQSYARRISYLVGEDGRVLQAYSSVSPSSHAEQVLADAKK